MCDWTSAQQFIGTRNVRTLVIDWPVMKAVLECDFPHIQSLALQRVYPSLSTLSSSSCILVKNYPEGIIDQTTIFHKPLDDYSVRWNISVPSHFTEIVKAFPRLLQGMATRTFSIKLIFPEALLDRFFMGGAPYLRNSIPVLLLSADAIMFGISISYPPRRCKRYWVNPWKYYRSPQAWVEKMEQDLYAYLPREGDGKVSGGIFWELSHHYHSWESPGRHSGDFLPPREDRHRYVFPKRVEHRYRYNMRKLPLLRE